MCVGAENNLWSVVSYIWQTSADSAAFIKLDEVRIFQDVLSVLLQ
jgi:hypothetical protein